MKLYQKHIILAGITFISVMSIAFTTLYTRTKEVSAKLVTTQKVYKAGTPIALDFELNTPVQTTLFVHTSYGSTSIASEKLSSF